MLSVAGWSERWVRVRVVLFLLMLGPLECFTPARAGVAEAAEPSQDWLGSAYGRITSSDTLVAALFGPQNPLDLAYSDWDRIKHEYSIPVRIGAYNWFHINNDGPNATDYGILSLPGTYFYYLDLDPELSLHGSRVQSHSSFFEDIGAHVEMRFRDSPVKFRSFFQNKYWWFYEGYGYVDTPIGRFKAGEIWKRFGLDWDDTWWGDVQYFDGLKLDTDYGVSWENTWRLSDTLSADSFVQYFITKSHVNGSEPGADPNSARGSEEYNIGVARLVPTWHLNAQSSIALGLSGLLGDIHNRPSLGPDQTEADWAADLTYRYGAFKIFAEVDQAYGRRNPRNYVSGGPSNQLTDVEAGAAYKLGPATFRFAWSGGFLANPSGRQFLWLPGMTLAATKNIDLIFEYIRWDVYKNKAPTSTTFENGFQLVVNWRL